jgi:hypothetical protein
MAYWRKMHADVSAIRRAALAALRFSPLLFGVLSYRNYSIKKYLAKSSFLLKYRPALRKILI